MNTWKSSKEFHSKKKRKKNRCCILNGKKHSTFNHSTHSIRNYRDRKLLFTLKNFASFLILFCNSKMTATSTNRAKKIHLIISILFIKAEQDWRDKGLPEMAGIMSRLIGANAGLFHTVN